MWQGSAGALREQELVRGTVQGPVLKALLEERLRLKLTQVRSVLSFSQASCKHAVSVLHALSCMAVTCKGGAAFMKHCKADSWSRN